MVVIDITKPYHNILFLNCLCPMITFYTYPEHTPEIGTSAAHRNYPRQFGGGELPHFACALEEAMGRRLPLCSTRRIRQQYPILWEPQYEVLYSASVAKGHRCQREGSFLLQRGGLYCAGNHTAMRAAGDGDPMLEVRSVWARLSVCPRV